MAATAHRTNFGRKIALYGAINREITMLIASGSHQCNPVRGMPKPDARDSIIRPERLPRGDIFGRSIFICFVPCY
jgi:hypothetical protein